MAKIETVNTSDEKASVALLKDLKELLRKRVKFYNQLPENLRENYLAKDKLLNQAVSFADFIVRKGKE